MAATDQQLLDKSRDSLARILDTDTSSWSESQRNQQMIQIDKLSNLIDRLEKKVASGGGRRILGPVRRVNL